MVGAAQCAERLEYGGPPAGPGRVGLHLVNANGKECYRKREGRRYTGPAHSAGTRGTPPSCAEIYNGWCCSGAQNSNSGDLDGPIRETLCKFCSWRCPLARNAPEQHSGAQKYLSMVMWVPQGCPSASFLGFFRAILASDGADKKKKREDKEEQ